SLAGKPPDLPRARQYHPGPGGLPHRNPHPRLGARRGPDAGLRHRGLCDRRRRSAKGADRAQGHDCPAGRAARHRVARGRRSHSHDRALVARRLGYRARGVAGRTESRRMSIQTITFGCRLNAYETEVMKAEAAKAGLENAILINTCAVTAEAVRQAKQSIRKARREHPGAKIIVTGCAAQTEARAFGDMAEVDLVIGNNDKLKAESYAPIAFGVPLNDKVQVNDIASVTETAGHLIDGLDGRARAFVQVQNGCDHRCTFCIIPYGRGPSRSVPMGVVVEQVKRLVGNGYAEVVLTGVDITSYGGDLPGTPTLGKLTQAILRHVPSLPRLRISSIDSIEADPALYEAVTEPRLMPHLHLSLQSGDD